MTCKIIKIEDNLLAVSIEGILHLTDQEAVQCVMKDIIRKYGSAKLLVVVNHFQGWSKQDDWGDLSFLMEYGAIVSYLNQPFVTSWAHGHINGATTLGVINGV